MKHYIRLSLLAAITINIALLTSCASAPRYHEVKASLVPESGKGLVIFYFKWGFLGGGPNRWNIIANDQLLTRDFKRGTFYSYQANPGELQIYTKRGNWVLGMPEPSNFIPIYSRKIQIEPNQTYYMEAGFPSAWALDFPTFKHVSREEGETEIKDCQWINPSKTTR